MGTRAVGYFREDAERDAPSASPVEQNRRLLEFCRQHGCEVASTFVDGPGETSERPGWRQ